MYREITDEKILEQLKNDKQLSNADLRNADIAAVTVNLENAQFDDANLEGANLKNVNLYDANLDGTNFTGANLEGAILERAIIRNANFTRANLKKANFENITDFRGTHFNGANCNDISFISSKLTGGDFTDANFDHTEFFEIDFKEAHLNGTHFVGCFFENCDFSEADLQGAHFYASEFEGADIIGVHLENADFTNVKFKNVNFEDSFLEGAIFQGVTKDENTHFDIDKLSTAQKEQLGISAKISLINELKKPNPDIPSLIEVIRNDEWDKEEVDNRGKTPLIIACLKNFENIALELIKTGDSNPGNISDDGTTALIAACLTDLENVALELIKTGDSNPGNISDDNTSALFLACLSNLDNVALALIATGESKPGHAFGDDDTPLIAACMSGMEDVALALINTGESNMYLMNNEGQSAFSLATEKNLTKVLNAFPKNIININQTGFDTINQENMVIGDYLKENPYNLVVMINNSYYFTSKDVIKKQIMDTANIKYGCRKAGENSLYTLDENIIYDIPYFSLSSLFGLQILIRVEDAEKMMDVLSGNMFILRKSIKLTTIISQNFIDGADGASADHCQSGKETDVYVVFSASPDCGTIEKVVESVKEGSEAVEESKDELSGMSNKVIILYKEGKYPISINDSITVEELKELFLDDLKSKGIVESNKNFSVRFIFKGKILKDDLPREIKENPADFTIQAVVNPISGGRKTIKKRKNMKKKTMKKGKNKKTMKTKRRRKSYKKKL
jgi:uncharacterized protein YjbI with pentapeptide repeats